MHPCLREQLELAGCQCDVITNLDKAGVKAIISSYQGLAVRSRFKVDQELIDAATNLRFIARPGSGLENIDVIYAESKNIKVFNSPEGNRTAVGEHTLGLLLGLFHQIPRANNQVADRIWDRKINRGIEVKGKTIGIIGYGHMGGAFARRLKGFECTILAYDKYKQNYSDGLVEESTMERLYEEADVISIHLPLTEETHYLVNREFLSAFKKPIYLLNTARGPIVKTKDLAWALENEVISGAGLDVLEYESVNFLGLGQKELPKAFEYLTQHPRVILTPHIAGITVESYEKMSCFLAEKVLAEFGNELSSDQHAH